MALIADASIIECEQAKEVGRFRRVGRRCDWGGRSSLLRSVVENESLSWPKEMMKYGALVLGEPEDLFDVLPYAGSDAAAQLAF